MHRLFLLFFIPFGWTVLYAQQQVVSGLVIDASSGEPLPYVNVSVKLTTTGAITDDQGSFSFFYLPKPNDSLQFRFVGYNPQCFPIEKFLQRIYTVELHQSSQTLPEVIILPGENPADIMLRKIIASKQKNNQEHYDYFSCEIYNKIRFDLNNFDTSFKEKRLLKPFAFVFDNADTSEVTGKTFLPIFISETVSDFYFRKSPKTIRENIQGVKVSGVKNESLNHFMGNMYVQTNIYDNFIVLFDKNFVSPVAANAMVFYRYYLTDSTYIDNQWCYKLEFRPRRKQELTFTGHMWVHDSTWSVVAYDMEMAADANINYVEYLSMSALYKKYDDTLWVKDQESFFVEFYTLTKTEKAPGFFGHKYTSFQKYSFSPPEDQAIFNTPALVLSNDEASVRTPEFWTQHRHDSLSKNDRLVYEMIDSIQQIKAYKTWSDIIQMIATGYYVGKNLEYGPYASLISFNSIEGTRLRFGIRTSNAFSTKIMPYGHIAYGFNDEQIKYGAGLWYMFSKIPRRAFNMHFKHDYELIGKSENAFREDFLIGTLFTRNPMDKLTMTDQLNIKYEHEWLSGFSVTLFFSEKNLIYPPENSFQFNTGGFLKTMSVIHSTEAGLQLRYAHKERFLSGEFERISLGSRYPIIRMRVFKEFSGYNYWKTTLNITHWFNLRGLGWSKYIVDAGMITGATPYPFLKIHEGNESFMLDEMSFNMMNYYEFVSNQWISVYYTHHFDGLFFNRIPLLRKMKLREVVWGKILFGNLDAENQSYNIFPENMFILSQPYIEAGAGIENIFRFFRVDVVWRHSYLNHPNVSPLGIFAGLQFYL
jgi:hypothetical protein